MCCPFKSSACEQYRQVLLECELPFAHALPDNTMVLSNRVPPAGSSMALSLSKNSPGVSFDIFSFCQALQ